MANLGVVPLLRLAAFLLRPLVLALRSLLLVVIFVADTISDSKENKYFFLIHLPDGVGNVKAIRKIALVFTLLFCIGLKAEVEKETLVLAKGEQLELSIDNIIKYSTGNNEIIATHFDHKNKTVYIKGKSLGFTDLILWQNKEKKHYLVYVISKKDHLELAKILELFPPPLWKANFIGDTLSLSGELSTWRQWNGLLALEQKKIPLDLSDVILEKTFKRMLLSDLYKELYLLGLEKFRCTAQRIPKLECWSQQDLSEDQLVLLRKKFPSLTWSKIKKFTPLRNVRVKVKILSFDYSQGEDWQKGFDYIKGHLNEIFDLGIWSMLKRNPVNFEKYWSRVNVLAEPEFTLVPNSEAKFNIGSEIPYYSKNTNSDFQQVEWKFAGLSIEMKVNPFVDDHKLKVNYKTSLSSPVQEQIEGHSQMAELIIDKDTNAILFDISYKVTSKSKNSLPFWSKIPVLNLLFGSEHEHQNNKKILAILNLKDL